MAICPNCGSRNVVIQMVETGAKTKNYGNGLGGNLHNAGRTILSVGTLGISDLFVKRRHGESKTAIKTEQVCICQDCGNAFDEPDSTKAKIIANGQEATFGGAGGSMFSLQDPTVRKAVEIALKQGQFSKPSLQTWLGKGRDYITSLEAWLVGVGVIEPFDGSKRPRKTLIRSLEEFDQMTSNTPKPEQ